MNQQNKCNKHKRILYLDINECEHSPCKYNCQNTEGSYICSCPAGFLLNPDGTSCRDLDECSTGQHLCQQTCINTQGSYNCACLKGYTQHGDDCKGNITIYQLTYFFTSNLDPNIRFYSIRIAPKKNNYVNKTIWTRK